MLTIPRPVRILATSIAALISASSLQAQTWDGNAGVGDSNINTANNWNPDIAPVNNGTANLIFAGSNKLTPSVNVPYSINSLTFDNTAGAFILSGSALSVGVGGITNNDVQLQTLNLNIVTTAATSSINATSGGISVGGTMNLGTNALTLTGSGAISLVSLLGTGTLNKGNAGTFNLTQTSALDADLNLSAGDTTLVDTIAPSVTANATSTITLSGPAFFVMNESLTLNGAQFARTGGNLTFGAGKVLTVQNSGDLISAGSLTLNGVNGIVNVTGVGSSIQSTGGSVTISNGTLATVSSGASMSSLSFFDIGGAGATSGLTVSNAGSSLTVSGANSFWGYSGGTTNVLISDSATANIGSLQIAQGTNNNTTGNVTVESGATVNGTTLTIANGGAGTGVSGTLTVTGAGSAWTQSGSSTLTVGAAASTVGILNVNSAGTFTSGTGVITIGTTGSVAIDDGILNANGNIVQNGQFTRSADGVLNLASGRTWSVQGGGDVLFLGAQTLTNNAVTVTGANSTLELLNDGFSQGILTLTGGASLLVSTAGSYTASSSYIGTNNTSGSLTVSGSGSTWFDGNVYIGGDEGATLGGSGSVLMNNDAQGSVASIYMGMNDGATSTLNLNSGSDLGVTDLLMSGPGYPAYISTNTVTVNGSGTSLGVGNTLYIGSLDGGTSSFTLENSAALSIASGANMVVDMNGTYTQTGGSLTVDGELRVEFGGSFTKSAGTMNFGPNANITITNDGDMTINDGGMLNIDANQVVTLRGAGSTLTGTGTASLSIRDGSSLIVQEGAVVNYTEYIDVGNSSTGTIEVDGAGSSLTATGDESYIGFGVGGDGMVTFSNQATGTYNIVRISQSNNSSGIFNVESGADVTVADVSLLYSGPTSGANAELNVSGTGSTFTATTINIGHTNAQGTASLDISAGASVTTSDLGVYENGFISLDGGSLTVTNSLTNDGGSLQFFSGLLALPGDVSVGSDSLLGENLVLGPAQRLVVGGEITVDPFQALVLAGGRLTTSNIVNNGQLFFDSGTLTITGAGGATIGSGQPLGAAFKLETEANFVVNNQLATAADGVLTMNGGSVTAGSFSNSGQIRINEGITNITGAATNNNGGQMFVSDSFSTGGTLTNASGGRITLRDGTGQLAGAGALSNTGLITGDGRITKALTNNAGGEVRAESGKTIAFTGANAANSGKFNLLGGTLEFAEAQTNGATGQINGHGTLNFANGLSNEGQMNFSGGNSDVFGVVNSVAGSRVITSGGSTATFYDAFTNNATEVRTSANSATVFFGLVNGAGPFTGTGEVYYEGGYSPGNSPALVTTESSIFFGNNNTLTMEIGGITAGSEYDKLVFNGEQLQFGGELVIALLQNFSLTAGMEFDLFDFDPNNAQGSFSNIRTAEPLANGLTIDTSKIASTGTFTVVPEPSSAALVMITSAMLGLRRRRNSRNQA